MARYILYLLLLFPLPLYATAQVSTSVAQYQADFIDLFSLILGVIIGVGISVLLLAYAARFLRYLRTVA